MQRSESTGKSPFELVTGHQPLTPNALAASYDGNSPAAYKTMKEWYEQADLARASLDKAAKKMKKWADKKRRHVEFDVGDKVMVKLLPQQFKTFRKVHKGLIRRYEGPFPVIGRVGKVSYRVELPPKLKIHPVFHMLQMQSELVFANPNSGDLKTGREKLVCKSPNLSMKKDITDLGDGSELVYCPRLFTEYKSWEYFNYLDKNISWTRPTIRVFGRQCLQPRDTCYIASKGLKDYSYSGYTPQAYCWDDFPPLKEILDEVQKAVPESQFNSLLLNRYKTGNDYASWHADNEKVYGPTPDIASISFGCERDFLLKKNGKTSNKSQVQKFKLMKSLKRKRGMSNGEVPYKTFKLKHGSLLMMRGNTQRDWVHSIPKRVGEKAAALSTRINLTFRLVL
ncbi:DNA oxidative demethylase ALKBH2-like [Rutidosis leptorrhynchoides]|uniref:DNA oxidative demethylase ALKBH2-like n=1 Tax=Rutidosis leptorrhynchoides TaxID=125765 RepID=UPI003A9A03D8